MAIKTYRPEMVTNVTGDRVGAFTVDEVRAHDAFWGFVTDGWSPDRAERFVRADFLGVTDEFFSWLFS